MENRAKMKRTGFGYEPRPRVQDSDHKFFSCTQSKKKTRPGSPGSGISFHLLKKVIERHYKNLSAIGQ